MPRKTLRQRIEEIQQNFIEGVFYYEDTCKQSKRVPDPDCLKYHLNLMKGHLRDLHLREADVTYHARDAEAKLAGARTRREEAR